MATSSNDLDSEKHLLHQDDLDEDGRDPDVLRRPSTEPLLFRFKPRYLGSLTVSRESWRKVMISAVTIIACLVLVSVITIAAISKTPDGGDPNPIPPIWSHTFVRRKLVPLNTSETEKAFTCLPNGNGLLYLSDDTVQQQRLPPGLPSGDGEGRRNLYAMAWAHEMYCLAMVRRELLSLMGNISTLNRPRSEQSPHERWQVRHLDGCIEYLRQKIMCVADTTLEYPTGTDPEEISGFGIEQTCAVKVPMGRWYEQHPPVVLYNFTGFGRYLKFPHWAEGP